MNYKGMLLGTLLFPASIMCSINDVDLHLINNLNEKQNKKLQELSEISEKIAKIQSGIDGWDEQFYALFHSAEQSDENLENSLNVFVANFTAAFLEKKDISSLLAGEFSVGSNYEHDFIKVFLVRRYMARLAIQQLVNSYEKCLQELIDLGK